MIKNHKVNYPITIELAAAIGEDCGNLHERIELNPELQELDCIWNIVANGKKGHYYPSAGHRMHSLLEERLAKIETAGMIDAEEFSALVFPRGMAAISATLEALGMQKDGVFIHGDVMYTSTPKILGERSKGTGRNYVGSKPGIKVNLGMAEELEATIKRLQAIGENILGLIFEPLANPTLNYADIKKIAEIAHESGILVITDNTFLTPVLLQPLKLGADIVIHSLTKYYSGEGDIMGGAVIARKELIPAIKTVRKEKGYTLDPANAVTFYQRARGIEERIIKHSTNARELYQEICSFEGVRVNYRRLDGITREGHAGGVLSFVFEGCDDATYAKARRFAQYLCENKGVVKHAVSFGEPKTLAIPYAGQLPIDFLKANGIPAGLVRIAAGREQDIGRVIQYIQDAIKYSLR